MFAESLLRSLIVNNQYLAGHSTYVNEKEYREFILADSGYPNCGYLVTPIDLKGRAHGLNADETYYNYRISRIRCKVEISIGALKNRW